MIGKIRGIILEKQPPYLLVDVHGVGYELSAPMSTFYHLPEIGKEIALLTHFVVREDAQMLFGFHTATERQLFRTLLKVNGVGPRLALTILSSLEANAFIQCVLNNDAASLVRVPGIGKKTAERLLIEMRDKLPEWQPEASATEGTSLKPSSGRQMVLQDAIAALVTLGYKPQEANRHITRMDDGASTSEELIRRALKELA